MKRKKPCSECPYKLGLVKTLINPCPQCRENGYNAFEWFKKHLAGEGGFWPDGDGSRGWTGDADNAEKKGSS